MNPYDCGVVHTTGYIPEGNQDGLPGLIGTWAEDGIGCEECHGPGSNHVNDPYVPSTIDRDSELCGTCHRRGDVTEIDASDGFIRHHEQYEELFESKKRVMRCVDCHDPHQTVKYASKGLGIKTDCENCHFENRTTKRSPTVAMPNVLTAICRMSPRARRWGIPNDSAVICERT